MPRPPKGSEPVPTKDDAPMLQHWPVTEQEEKCQALFNDLTKLFKRIEKTNKADKVANMLKDLTAKLKEAKALIKDFEREARADDMPSDILQERRRLLVNGLNGFIAQKNDLKALNMDRAELMTGAQLKEEEDMNKMSTQQLITKGKRELVETDAALGRAERLVEDTLQIGTQTAGALNDQTKQLEKIVDDLNEIEFDMKKATKIIRDITRGMLTDKCIMFLMFLVVAGIVVIVVLKIVKPNKSKIADSLNNSTFLQQQLDLLNNLTNQAGNSISGAVNQIPTGNTIGRRLEGAAPGELGVAEAWNPLLAASHLKQHLQQAEQQQQQQHRWGGGGGPGLHLAARKLLGAFVAAVWRMQQEEGERQERGGWFPDDELHDTTLL